MIDFKTRGESVHGNKYCYDKSEYKNAHTPVIIICSIHGEFSQRPDAHLFQKQGCPKCGLINRKIPHQKTTEQFILEAKSKWGYDYSNTVYVNKETKIEYTCQKHGKVLQKPRLHLKSGCPYCNGRGIGKHTSETFINIANHVHDFSYDYSLVKLTKVTDYIDIICNKHGVFSQRANNHIHLENGCPKCDIEKTSSRAEKSILRFIESIYSGTILANDRVILSGKEIDVYLPDLKIGIEYHGMYWHLETIVGKNYHLDKLKCARQAGVRLIQVYESEWLEKQEIVKSKIGNLLGKSSSIYARNTVVRKLGAYEKSEFLNRTHLQGEDGSSIGYGLFYEGKLVACMTFGTSRFNRKYKYELIRFSSGLGINVVGGASKLLSHFRLNHSGSIISYADCRWSEGNLYDKIGFRLDGESSPSFSYFNIKGKKIFNRMNFQKKNLKGMIGYDDSLTEYEIMKLNGYDRIWDAGQYRFVIGDET